MEACSYICLLLVLIVAIGFVLFHCSLVSASGVLSNDRHPSRPSILTYLRFPSIVLSVPFHREGAKPKQLPVSSCHGGTQGGPFNGTKKSLLKPSAQERARVNESNTQL